MDVSCDGDARDGPCSSYEGTKNSTPFNDAVQYYSKGKVADLNPNSVPFVVLGNYGTTPEHVHFEPAEFGVKPLGVMAVVCGDKLVSLLPVARFTKHVLMPPGLRSLGRCDLGY